MFYYLRLYTPNIQKRIHNSHASEGTEPITTTPTSPNQ